MLLGAVIALLLLQQADYQAEGRTALDAHDYPAAIAAFEKAVAADPADYGAQFSLAFAHSLAGHSAEAAAGYRKVLELKPGLYEAETNLGVVLLQLKQPAEAARMLLSAQQQKPEEFRPTYYLAEALMDSGDAAGAEQQFRTAARIDPKSAAAVAGIGRALMEQGRLKDSEAELRRAVGLDPEYRDLLLQLAERYEQQKEDAAAIAIYQGFTGDPNVRERLGELLLESGRAEDAIPHLEAAVKTSPTAANRYALAIAYLRSGRDADAKTAMEQALDADPANFDLRLAYAGLLRDQKDYQAAAQQFLRLTQARPQSKESWSGLATMLLSLKNYPQAVAAFGHLEALGDVKPGVYFLRALAYDNGRQYEPALADYQKFLSLSKDQHPDEEFQARQRIKAIERELKRR